MCIICDGKPKPPANRGARRTYSLCAFCGEYGWREHESEYLQAEYGREASRRTAAKRKVVYLDRKRKTA